MQVRITGLIIPSTNVWEIDENWTARHLVIDVINLVSEKKLDGWDYKLQHNGKDVPDHVFLEDEFAPDTEFAIVGG